MYTMHQKVCIQSKQPHKFYKQFQVEIAQYEAPCDFSKGVAHCTSPLSEDQASSGVHGVKVSS